MPGTDRPGRIVVVGASLAGLRAAEALRDNGFTGELTLVGEEDRPPYDRPPLSKAVLLGRVRAADVTLPARRAVDARWRLGVRAEGVDLTHRTVLLAGGERLPYLALIH
uniref:FAD-dependent oxidoreductase n=1 Tax=Streptomyces clavuligerus TaxID=1901 RepID=UPI0018D1E923